MTDTTPKTRTKNTALYAVEMPGAEGTTRVVAYVRSTSTSEAKAATPITARRLGFDEAARVLRSGHPIMGMALEAEDDRQIDFVGGVQQFDRGAFDAAVAGGMTQDVDHRGQIDKSDLPPAKTVNEALAAGVKVRDTGEADTNDA